MAEVQQEPDQSGIKFGPFWLVPGVSRVNACTFFVCSFTFVTLVTFINFVQPYILEEILHIPVEQQGTVTGYLNFLHEGTALIIMGVVGAISDRSGRRMLLITGFLIWAVGFMLFPTAASLTELYFYRLIFAVGVATASVMVIATMQDFPQEVSRGKWGGLNSFITSFAILTVSLILARLPGNFEGMGYPPEQAARYTYWLGAFIAILAAVIFRFGFFKGRIIQDQDVETRKSPIAGFIAGLRAANDSPRLALSYASAFAARGDIVVIGAFYSLWFVRAGAEQGVDPGQAIIAAGQSLGALLLANWLWAPVFGIIVDRINRVVALCIAMTLATIGYYMIGTVSDPYDMPVMLAATFVLGIGEISAIVAGNALLGQEAPAKIRGASVGVFGLVGTTGILFATFFGGRVFDSFGPGAPFTMMAGVNAIIVLIAILIILSGRSKP
ncbi:MAG: MFS transporter [Gammaproteobacteria bacterium]|nr:MFS transporter [Gammaproteobacteria bacterium]MCP4089498.1 MFS transporter [Gammaproteobacteria bacterium]MCP4276204.1 MFS transporter [Gammaproteobacteria bacterium]MCP4832901.1 MFS transporter [Gammaproteobacteria bacterium]MCP4930026.1 MFS transporter [Gammaproteobacteria bacterium]